MLSHRRNAEAAQRFAERRRREDEAPRLSAVVPNLTDLKIEIEERRAGGVLAEASHIRRIVVEHAPALFWVPCGDPACKEGGHDVTAPLLRALQQGQTNAEGEDVCTGRVGSADCHRTVRWIATATYR
jgi:hypothetical protein